MWSGTALTLFDHGLLKLVVSSAPLGGRQRSAGLPFGLAGRDAGTKPYSVGDRLLQDPQKSQERWLLDTLSRSARRPTPNWRREGVCKPLQGRLFRKYNRSLPIKIRPFASAEG